MMNYKNLPVIPAFPTEPGYAVRFAATAEQMEKLLNTKEVYYNHDRVTSLRELPNPDAQIVRLEVEGVSHWVPCWCCEGASSRVFVHHAGWMLAINDKLYNCWATNPQKTLFSFRLVGAADIPDGFEFSKQPPQRVGVATEKKLLAWVEWLDAREAAIRDYLQAGKDADMNLMRRLEKSGAEYVREGNKVTIFNGPLKMSVEIGVHRIFPANLQLNYQYLYEKAVRKGEYLDFMLDNIVTVTPRK